MRRISYILLLAIFSISCEVVEESFPPELYSPPEGDHLISPTFIWQKTGYMFQLQVSRDSSFDVKIIYKDLTDTSFTPQYLLDYGIHYWRVRAKDDYGWGDWSEIQKFYVAEPTLQLLSPSDADTNKSPLLVWAAVESISEYRLLVYKGQPEAGLLALDTVLYDTFYQIQEELSPATYHWWISLSRGDVSESRRFVTYTLDETYFPVGSNFVWGYKFVNSSWGEGYSNSDSGFFDINIENISAGDSVHVEYSGSFPDIGKEVFYKRDSIFCIFEETSEVFECRLFPEEGDSIWWGKYYPIQFDSDSTLWFGIKPSDGYGEYWYYYICRERGIGLIEYSHGHGIWYHTEPEKSWGESWTTKLVEFNGQEF